MLSEPHSRLLEIGIQRSNGQSWSRHFHDHRAKIVRHEGESIPIWFAVNRTLSESESESLMVVSPTRSKNETLKNDRARHRSASLNVYYSRTDDAGTSCRCDSRRSR